MKMTTPQKRAQLFREWNLALIANDEYYYDCTLYEGIPDGDTQEDVLYDLRSGFYDDDLGDMIDLYQRAKRRYGKAGWYVGKKLYFDEDAALEAAGILIPDRICKTIR